MDLRHKKTMDLEDENVKLKIKLSDVDQRIQEACADSQAEVERQKRANDELTQKVSLLEAQLQASRVIRVTAASEERLVKNMEEQVLVMAQEKAALAETNKKLESQITALINEKTDLQEQLKLLELKHGPVKSMNFTEGFTGAISEPEPLGLEGSESNQWSRPLVRAVGSFSPQRIESINKLYSLNTRLQQQNLELTLKVSELKNELEAAKKGTFLQISCHNHELLC